MMNVKVVGRYDLARVSNAARYPYFPGNGQQLPLELKFVDAERTEKGQYVPSGTYHTVGNDMIFPKYFMVAHLPPSCSAEGFGHVVIGGTSRVEWHVPGRSRGKRGATLELLGPAVYVHQGGEASVQAQPVFIDGIRDLIDGKKQWFVFEGVFAAVACPNDPETRDSKEQADERIAQLALW